MYLDYKFQHIRKVNKSIYILLGSFLFGNNDCADCITKTYSVPDNSLICSIKGRLLNKGLF